MSDTWNNDKILLLRPRTTKIDCFTKMPVMPIGHGCNISQVYGIYSSLSDSKFLGADDK